MSLKNFRPDNTDFEDEDPLIEGEGNNISSTGYHEEINTLKIDKLSNRVTIISIILPCLIGAILVFGYLDMKERVVDVDVNKQSQYEKISKQLEEKLNALDVKIAKNKYDLDNTLPGLEKKDVALEGQLTKKADSKALKAQISKLERRVTENVKQAKSMNDKTLLTLKETQGRIDKTGKQIKDEIALFKEEFDARLLELSDYEQQIGELRKDLSLLDKKQKNMIRESISKTQFDKQINSLETQFGTLSQKLNTDISKFKKDLGTLKKSLSSVDRAASKGGSKPSPQINIDSSDSETIKEEPLNQ